MQTEDLTNLKPRYLLINYEFLFRYPSRYVQEMVDGMVSLLTLSTGSLLSPGQVLAALDPDIIWVNHWFHSLLSRQGWANNLEKIKLK